MIINKIIDEDAQQIIDENDGLNELYNSSVMITGATGMIGSYFVYTLMKLNEDYNANIEIIPLVRNLNKLTIGDISYIYYGGIKYTYKVNNIYDIEKTGTATITRDLNKTTLTMITCRHNTNKQIVIISELINQESY